MMWSVSSNENFLGKIVVITYEESTAVNALVQTNAFTTFIFIRTYWIINVYYIPTYAQINSLNLY
jgi:hypothetical protein